MHDDGGADHYMRYFVVMDPVGRLLGFHKRSFGDGMSEFVNVSKLTPAQIAQEALEPHQIADIRDCTHVQIYTEDVYDALARSVIRLR